MIRSEIAQDHLAEIIELRRDIHANPELRFTERRTAGLVAERLAEVGYRVTDSVAGTGVIATSETGEGPHVVIRADLDALPLQDTKEVKYVSRNADITHACGHDVHTAVAVGVAELLARTGRPAGRLTFLFQPAEEVPFGERSGAEAILATGQLDFSGVDAVLGLHCWPDLDVGRFGIGTRYAMSAKDAFRVRVKGRSAHAANPAAGNDALAAACLVVSNTHHLASRELSPFDHAVVHVGTLNAGVSQSVIASSAELTGTIRTCEPEVRTRLREGLELVARSATAAYKTECDVEWANEMPAVVNDPELVSRAVRLIERKWGQGAAWVFDNPPMTTDDFALYSELAPALYMQLGVRGDAGVAAPLHNPDFDVDERCIGYGMEVLSLLAMDLLEGRPLVPMREEKVAQ